MKPEKQQIIEDLQKQVGASPYVLLTDYIGLTVSQFSELRKRLRSVQAECHVVKNSMLQRALAAAGLPKPDGSLTGMTALVVGAERAEINAAAKVLKQFAKECEKPRLKLGFMGQQLLRAEEVSSLADLPSKDELRAMFVGLLQTPATRLAVVLGAPASQIARVLHAYAEQNQGATEEVASA